jgi:hypothetical protein
MTPIDEMLLDKVTFSINLAHKAQLIKAQVVLDDENDLRALQRFLGLWSLDDLNIIAQGIAEKHTVGMDMQEMAYPHPRNPQFEGVKVGDGMSYSVHLTHTILDQLILKLFDTLNAKVQAEKPNLTSSDKWEILLKAVATIRKRNS